MLIRSKLANIMMVVICYFSVTYELQAAPNHLFILAGQSNMLRLNPEASFIPTLKQKLTADSLIVVKDAKGTQPIRRWYKNWQPLNGTHPENPSNYGNLYNRLMKKVMSQIEGKQIDTVTLIWMQGERDAREQHGEIYRKSLAGLISQLSADLQRKDINIVVGRLSDFATNPLSDNGQIWQHWNLIRDEQVKFAVENERAEWVNTDDLNDGIDNRGILLTNDIHYSVDGYIQLGRRFALKALSLIEKDKAFSG